ncbi:MAG: CopG family transcriptional regulator [Hyphomicrobium sp.]
MPKAIDLAGLRKKHGKAATSSVDGPRRAEVAPDLRLGAKETTVSNQMNIRVSDDFKRLLGVGARKMGVSMAQLVEDAVTDYLARQRKDR